MLLLADVPAEESAHISSRELDISKEYIFYWHEISLLNIGIGARCKRRISEKSDRTGGSTSSSDIQFVAAASGWRDPSMPWAFRKAKI